MSDHRLDQLFLAATLLIIWGAAAFLRWSYAADIAGALMIAVWTVAVLRKRRTKSLLLLSAWAGWCLAVSGGFINAATSLLVIPGIALLIHTARACRSIRAAAGLGFVAGLICFGIGLNWLPGAFSYFSDRNAFVGFLLMAPLIALMSLKYCLLAMAIQAARASKCEWGGITTAAVLVLLEITFARIVPVMLGVRLFPFKPLIQVADLAGIAGLGFLLVLVVYQLCQAVPSYRPLRLHYRPAAVGLGLLVAWTSYGLWRMNHVHHQTAASNHFTVGIVQTNTRDTARGLSQDAALKIATQIVQSAARLATRSPAPDLIVYAEATAPMGFEADYNSIFRDAYQVSARQSGIPIMADNFGSRPPANGKPAIYWREILLLESDRAVQSYTKRQLVPIGEILPFETTFPALRRFFRHGRSFLAGDAATVFDINGTKVAPIICFEALNPRLVRHSVNNGAQVLINPANDAWFNSTKQARQHLWAAAFRAVEFRLPLVRSANTGISAFIDQTGQITAASPLNAVWEHSAPVATPPMRSPYRSGGYLFSWLCAAVAAAAVGQALRPRR